MKEDRKGVTVEMMRESIQQMCERHEEPEAYDMLVAWVFEMQEVSWNDVLFRYHLLQFPEGWSIKALFGGVQEQYQQVISRLALMHQVRECS